MTKVNDQTKDWRGVTIKEGQTVIYGAPVGRSIALVEAVVDGFTDSGRVWLKVKHRAYGDWGDSAPRVHVGHDRLTIIDSLPPTTLPDQGPKKKAEAKKKVARYTQALADLDSGKAKKKYMARDAYLPNPAYTGDRWWDHTPKYIMSKPNEEDWVAREKSERSFCKREIKKAQRVIDADE